MTDADITALAERYIAGSDPIPAQEQNFVGDGEFRLIGAEFLRHFVTTGGMRPEDQVLEIGCGLGRMALPMRHYLSTDGRYHGVDVVHDGIIWCQQSISTLDPRFQFSLTDLYHPIYNVNGSMSALDFVFPASDGSVDFLILTSVFTHLPRNVYERYLSEARRVLSPRGRLFGTFFVINRRSRDFLEAGASRYAFDLEAPDVVYHVKGESPLGAVAVEQDWLIDTARARNLVPMEPLSLGFWSNNDPGDGVSYQDILVFQPV